MDAEEGEKVHRIWTGTLVAAMVLLVGMTSAAALPVISIDLDPGLAGIQATRAVDSGEVFTIDIVYTGDGAAVFDTFGYDVFFNDMGAGVLGLSGGGMPTLGSVRTKGGSGLESCILLR